MEILLYAFFLVITLVFIGFGYYKNQPMVWFLGCFMLFMAGFFLQTNGLDFQNGVNTYAQDVNRSGIDNNYMAIKAHSLFDNNQLYLDTTSSGKRAVYQVPLTIISWIFIVLGLAGMVGLGVGWNKQRAEKQRRANF